MIEVIIEPAAFRDASLEELTKVFSNLKEGAYCIAWGYDYDELLTSIIKKTPEHEVRTAVQNIQSRIKQNLWKVNYYTIDQSQTQFQGVDSFDGKKLIESLVSQYYEDEAGDNERVLFVAGEENTKQVNCGEEKIEMKCYSTFQGFFERCREETLKTILANWSDIQSDERFNKLFKEYVCYGKKNNCEFAPGFYSFIKERERLSDREVFVQRVHARISVDLADKYKSKTPDTIKETIKKLHDEPFTNTVDGTAYKRLSQAMSTEEEKTWRHFRINSAARVHYHLIREKRQIPLLKFRWFFPDSQHIGRPAG